MPGDPFLGIHSAPKATETAAAQPRNPSVQAASGPIPPLPASYTSAGTAPMAVGETATPENPREMRMAGESMPAGSSSSGAARGAAPIVNVGNPQPVPLIGSTTSMPATPAFTGVGNPVPASPPAGGSAANIRTYEEAQQYLKTHRVSWQRMSGDGDEWKFSCGIPNPSNSHVNKTYQTNQPFPDLLSAMRAVIAQIEQTPQ